MGGGGWRVGANPPVVPTLRSITYPMVYLTTSPFSSNVSEHACGGLTSFLFVGSGAKGRYGPVLVP